jgi:TolB protein
MKHCRTTCASILIGLLVLSLGVDRTPAWAIPEFDLGIEKMGSLQPIWLEPFTMEGDQGKLGPMARAGEAILVDDLVLSGYFRVDGPVAANLAPRNMNVARSKGPDLTAIVYVKLVQDAAGKKLVGRVVSHPAEKLIFEKPYPITGEIRPVIHTFADDIVFHLTGEQGIALTKVACICGSAKAKEVLVIDYDGNAPRYVTRDQTSNSPAWSPVDGIIAYTSFKRGEVDLYGVNVETGAAYGISQQPGIDTAPAWSPDGRFLAVTLSLKGNPDVYLIRRNGEVVDRITMDPAIDSSPSFSPTGRQLAFMSDRLGSPQLFITDVDGLNVTRIPIPQGYADSPAWSPKGDRIAYAARTGPGFDIFVTTLDGSVVHQLTLGWGSNENPRWAPSGRHIVFSSSRSGKRGVYVMNADGSDQRRLTPADRDCFYPTWSPRPAKAGGGAGTLGSNLGR